MLALCASGARKSESQSTIFFFVAAISRLAAHMMLCGRVKLLKIEVDIHPREGQIERAPGGEARRAD
jgi:hypothetical protein